MKKLAQLAYGVALGVALAGSASGAVITYILDDEFSGGTTPAGTFTATFDDTACGIDCVQLTMAPTGAAGSGEFVSDWWFNFDDAQDLFALVFAFDATSTGPTATVISRSENNLQADGGNDFDIRFSFATSNSGGGIARFDVNETVVYNITGIVGLTASDFDFLAFDDGSGNGGGAHSAAHVQGIGPNENLSGFITDNGGGGPGGELPEPNALWLLGMGLVALAVTRRRKPRL